MSTWLTVTSFMGLIAVIIMWGGEGKDNEKRRGARGEGWGGVLAFALHSNESAHHITECTQVLCNALVPAVLCHYLMPLTGGLDILLDATLERRATQLLGGILGYLCCCCGDTWSSEVGQLSKQQPRLVTTGRRVQAGTNGGITALGLQASAGVFVVLGLGLTLFVYS